MYYVCFGKLFGKVFSNVPLGDDGLGKAAYYTMIGFKENLNLNAEVVTDILLNYVIKEKGKKLADNIKRKVADRLTEYVCNLGE